LFKQPFWQLCTTQRDKPLLFLINSAYCALAAIEIDECRLNSLSARFECSLILVKWSKLTCGSLCEQFKKS
jgi:hypothetical protein